MLGLSHINIVVWIYITFLYSQTHKKWSEVSERKYLNFIFNFLIYAIYVVVSFLCLHYF